VDFESQGDGRWLLLIHQIPPTPAYARVKIGRRLARIGAVALKNTVYVLPRSDAAHEDFQWVRGEVVAAGGDATLLVARFASGLSDADVEALFQSARDALYAEVAQAAASLSEGIGAGDDDDRARHAHAELARLDRRMEEIAAIDYFAAPGRKAALARLESLHARLARTTAPTTPIANHDAYRRRTWVTRSGVSVDRIASAWLIRRFIDFQANFKFVPAAGYKPLSSELRFDMFEAEFSHEGERCTFEVLCNRFQLEAVGLDAIAEIVHDIDIKDDRFHRPEAAGVMAHLSGLCLVHSDDNERLLRGAQSFDELLAHFASKAT
jgi:hypothetical protein